MWHLLFSDQEVVEPETPPVQKESFREVMRSFERGESLESSASVMSSSSRRAVESIPSTSEKISHFVNLSDKNFESKVFKGQGDQSREVIQRAAESAAVRGKVKLFENVSGIEYARPAEQPLSELSSRKSTDSVRSIPLSTSRSNTIRSAEMELEPFESSSPKRVMTILEAFGQQVSSGKDFKLRSAERVVSSPQTVHINEKPAGSIVRITHERLSEAPVHQTGSPEREILTQTRSIRKVSIETNLSGL